MAGPKTGHHDSLELRRQASCHGRTLVASCFLGALPPVDLRAVCWYGPWLLATEAERRGGSGMDGKRT